MRGKAFRPCQWYIDYRITPAHAGKSPSFSATRYNTEDHPRACGEKLFGLWSMAIILGSPPRMRGKEAKSNVCGSQTGITPAHAGKSFDPCKYFRDAKDHPRACGEKPHSLNFPSKPIGSPPRMRGKVAAVATMVSAGRITPAHAGKSSLLAFSESISLDHPRACGEKTSFAMVPLETPGSPPRMRGKD